MADDAAAATFQVDLDFDDESLVLIMGSMSTSDVRGADIIIGIDRLFDELYTSATGGTVFRAGLDALSEVRSLWRYMREQTDDLTMTCFYMLLNDRILHDASIYGRRQNLRYSWAVRELAFNLNFAYSQDEPTPFNLRVCTRTLSA